jgi:hypothetical protein
MKDFRSFDYGVIVQAALDTVAQYAVDDDGMPFVMPDDGFKFLSWDRIRMHRDVAIFVHDNAYDLRKMRNTAIGFNFGLARSGFDANWGSDDDDAAYRLERDCAKLPTFSPAWSRQFKDTVAL